MATQANLDYVQKMFVAYLGRAASESAQEYYADLIDTDADLGKAQLFDDLFSSAEAQALYSGKTNDQVVEMIFQNCFNRDPSLDGLNYYTTEIAAGTFNILEAAGVIADNADADGAAILAAKQTAADKITTEMGTDATSVAAYAANSTAARESLNKVTDAASAAAYDGAAELAAVSIGAQVGSTFALTVNPDTIFGTAGNDTITGTNLTLNTADVIADSSSVDSDTLTVSTPTDLSATPTIIGIENVVFNATDVNSGGDTDFDIDLANIAASSVRVEAIKAGTLIDTATLTNAGSITVNSALATISLATQANADVVVNGTGASGTTVTQTGTADTLTVTTADDFTTTGTTAEEAITITAGGDVSITDATATAAGADVAYTITAGGDIDVVDVTDTGTLTATSTAGDITIGATNLFTDGAISLTTAAGDITVTNAADAASSLTIVAVGDGSSSTTGADGDVTVTLADNVTSASINATGGVAITTMAAATTVTIAAGQASSADDMDAMTTLNLESNSSSSTNVVFDLSTTDAIVALDTVTATGANGLTVVFDGTDMVDVSADAALVATDNTTGGTTVWEIDTDIDAALDLSGVAFDVIELSGDVNGGALTIANNATVKASVTQTNLQLTSAAVPSQSVTVILDHDTAGTGVTLTDLTTTNLATVNLQLADAAAAYVLSDISMGTAGLVVTGSAASLTVTTYTGVGSIDASGLSGNVTVSAIVSGSQITTGGGADSFTVNDGASTTVNIDGGAGVDTVVFTASDDFSSATLNLTNIEKLDVTADGVVLAADDLTGKSYVVFGAALDDDLTVEVNSTTGETVDLSDFSAALAKITVTGNNGGDAITGLANFATTINAGAGNDTVTGGNLVDTIDGEGGNDTIVAGEGADSITGGTGADTITLTESVSAQDTVIFAAVGEGSAASASGSFSGFDVITGFTSLVDKVNVAGITTAATEFQVIKSTAPAGTDNDIADADYAKVVEVVAFLETANTVVDEGGAQEYVIAVSYSDFTAIYAINDDGDDTVEAGEVTLLGTVDVVTVAGDYVAA